jgi:hypothetical protein
MKFSEAIKLYEQGESVRYEGWADDQCIRYDHWDVYTLSENEVNGFWELYQEKVQLDKESIELCVDTLLQEIKKEIMSTIEKIRK